MKILYIEARSKKQIPLTQLRKIQEKRIGLVTTVQHLSQLKRVKKELEQLGKKVFISKGVLAQHPGQVLGCDVNAGVNVASKVDALLYVGSGDFHMLQLALKTQKKIYTLSSAGILDVLSKERVDKYLKRKKAAYLRFLHEDKIGIIVSLKPGQENLMLAMTLKERLHKKGKKPFVFLCNHLHLDELENLDCKSWITTACPGLQLEPGFLNAADLANFLK